MAAAPRLVTLTLFHQEEREDLGLRRFPPFRLAAEGLGLYIRSCRYSSLCSSAPCREILSLKWMSGQCSLSDVESSRETEDYISTRLEKNTVRASRTYSVLDPEGIQSQIFCLALAPQIRGEPSVWSDNIYSKKWATKTGEGLRPGQS